MVVHVCKPYAAIRLPKNFVPLLNTDLLRLGTFYDQSDPCAFDVIHTSSEALFWTMRGYFVGIAEHQGLVS